MAEVWFVSAQDFEDDRNDLRWGNTESSSLSRVPDAKF
jgi:hypothetical protein